jgi:LysR family carnitine catabolism transcriptional activator
LRNSKSITLKDLEDEEFVSLPTAAGLRRQIDGIAATNGIALKHMTVVGQFGTLFDFVAADVGVAIVPASALPRRRQYDVVVKRLVSPSIVRSVGILRLKNRALTPAASGFLDIFRPLFLSASRR